ncbi:OmpA family protein [Frigoriflavimonas asaccharolytica]|uniref:Outer membrane protein OmpA-like peptidoglycan-associated protein n=1 Tax=Frigoriflavimonas asaccharolytica TaxID=2735899 RepID=A0A8J8G6P7_9FLAO|nr:OmpA family protein [Frigoriflavimonas asaccharolytica]NRS92016.1 outer membrane protein OmpA-like peptidoglycan-associated protein [Frigoriflavimonas asaccharolytica]
MKNLKLILASALLASSTFGSLNAQVNPTEKVDNKKSYWQISARGGFDFPTYKEDFRLIDYKGGFMGGVSINKYWNWFGIQADADFIKNTPEGVDLAGQYPGKLGAPEDYTSFETQKKDISRTFVGIGPAFKYETNDNKFSAELGLLGGIGFINGGEILIDGVQQNLTIKDPITYHSGFDNEKVFSTKAQMKFNYWFHPNWSVNAGAYYMNHYNVEESDQNVILNANYPIAPLKMYYFERDKIGDVYQNTGTTRMDQPGSSTTQMEKMNLSSVGVFAGISYRFGKTKKNEEIVNEVAAEKTYRLVITAKDKYTGQVIPNTQVFVKDYQGNIINTAMTDTSGKVYVDGINPNNYQITGDFNKIPLDPNATKTGEFVANGDLNKEIIYSDRNFILKGKTFQCNSSVPLSGAAVYLENKFDAYKKSTLSDANGEFILQLPPNATYELYAKQANYFSQVEMINTQNYSRDRNLFVNIEICAQQTECGKGIALKDILYDLDKFFIREDAKPELNKLVRFLEDNPSVKVELGSHTDSRGSDAYNLKLSQNRAQAAVDYIITKGISRDRIVAKGYGETVLLNQCANGVQCSDAEQQINRRTEFKVICPK